jgi:hypothetical protein
VLIIGVVPFPYLAEEFGFPGSCNIAMRQVMTFATYRPPKLFPVQKLPDLATAMVNVLGRASGKAGPEEFAGLALRVPSQIFFPFFGIQSQFRRPWSADRPDELSL